MHMNFINENKINLLLGGIILFIAVIYLICNEMLNNKTILLTIQQLQKWNLTLKTLPNVRYS